MKKTIFLLSTVLLFSSVAYSQLRIGYVDSDSIMELLPDAQDAQQQLDILIQQWQQELDEMQKDWKAKYDDYEKTKLIMSDERRAEIEAELVKQEQAIVKYRESKFGSNGELFTQQEQLMEPVQNRVFLAIEEVAADEDLDFVFDRSGGVLMLFAKEEYDITSLVLEKLK